MLSLKRIKADAYMTVEAALVIPAAIFGMVLIIYMSFLVYGRCLLSQDVYILGFRAGLLYEKQDYKAPSEYIKDHSGEKTKGKYFGSSDPEISSVQRGKEITVKGKIKTKHRALGGYFGGIPKIWESEAAAKVKLHNNAKTVRRIKRARDILGRHVKKERQE